MHVTKGARARGGQPRGLVLLLLRRDCEVLLRLHLLRGGRALSYTSALTHSSSRTRGHTWKMMSAPASTTAHLPPLAVSSCLICLASPRPPTPSEVLLPLWHICGGGRCHLRSVACAVSATIWMLPPGKEICENRSSSSRS